MCGIAGLYDVRAILPDRRAREDVLRRMTNSMVHRGPDASGTWSDPDGRCDLGHRRLSIIDTSDAGRQPMSGEDGRWVISFNGEIYNFQEIRPVLEREGLIVHGKTDTEVLLESIALWGLEALPKLDGMFAFAAFNRESGELILARDPFGEKPLYYMEIPGGGLAFASELQALERVPGFDAEVSVDAMAEVLMFQYIGAPRTIYRNVKKLLPAHWLAIRPGESPRLGRYYEFLPGTHGFDRRPLTDLADELEDILLRSIRRRLISDVPLGAFLSGGVDSSTVCALILKKLGVPLNTYSIGFEDAPESEHEMARVFARHLGANHHDQILAPNTSDFLMGIGRVLDEPNADSSCMPTYLLSEFARQQVTVAISGDGGDEMFAGYGRYFMTLDEEQSRMRGGRSTWQPGRAYYADRILVSVEPHIRELFGEVPEGLAEHLHRLREEINQPNPELHCRLRKSDADNYMPGAVLPKVDRMSMQHSLEVRTPFLNTELARFAERLPLDVLYRSGNGKLILREIAYRYLPREMIDAPKKGFGIPMSKWGRDALLDVATDLLGSDESHLRTALGGEAIDTFMRRQRSRTGFATYQVWSLAMLESWMRHHPAKIPKLSGRKTVNHRSFGKRHAAPSGPVLRLDGLGVGGLFCALEGDTLLVGAQRDPDLGVPEETLHRIVRLFSQVTRADLPSNRSFSRKSSQRSIFIPGWGAPLRAPGWKVKQALRGATLFFPDADASTLVDSNELDKFEALGIGSLVFFHPYRFDGTLLQLKINQGAKFLRLVRTLIASKRIAVAEWTLSEASHVEGKTYLIEKLKGIPSEFAEELNSRYMVFEGMRQLAPTPVSHDDIRTLGGGRYSIWMGNCFFSPIGAPRNDQRYWMVEETPDTASLLQYTPAFSTGFVPGEHDPVTRIDSWFKSNYKHVNGVTLREGDRVAVLTHALPPGGAERQWCYLAIGLKQRGLKVTFVATEPLEGVNAHYLQLLEAHDLDIVRISDTDIADLLPLALDARQREWPWDSVVKLFGGKILQLLATLRTLRPKALFAQLDVTNLLGAVAGALAGVPRTLLSFRNYNPSNFSYLNEPWFLPVYQAVCSHPGIILSGNSRAANTDYANWIGISEERVTHIPNAIDMNQVVRPSDSALANLREELGVHPNQAIVLGVYRLSEEKAPLVFLEVIRQLQIQVPRLKVFVAGVGPMLRELETTRDKMGLGETVQYLGRREDVPALMSISSLLLLTSNFEGMPNVALEAQALGLPVVATDVGGVSDCVKDAETGFVGDVGDVGGLSSACAQILGDPDLAERMSHAGIELMGDQYSIAALAERHVRVINDGPTISPESTTAIGTANETRQIE